MVKCLLAKDFQGKMSLSQMSNWPNDCRPNVYQPHVCQPNNVSRMSVGQIMLAKCLSAKCLSAKCLSTKCLSAKLFSTQKTHAWVCYIVDTEHKSFCKKELGEGTLVTFKKGVNKNLNIKKLKLILKVLKILFKIKHFFYFYKIYIDKF